MWLQSADGGPQTALALVIARLLVAQTAAFVVRVFGDVEYLCEQAASTDELFGLVAIQLRQPFV